jgi:electron transfer flavoprotein alpha subunit
MPTVLILVEANPDGTLRKATLNAISAGQKVAAAIAGDVQAVVLAKDASALAAAVKDHVKVVHAGSAPHFEHPLAEAIAPAVATLAESLGAEYVIGAATAFGRDVLPRIAARLKAAMASDVLSVEGAGAELAFGRGMWAGAVLATVKLSSKAKVLSVRATEFPLAPGGVGGEVKAFSPAAPEASRSRHVAFKEVKSARPALTEAKVVVSGGRGTKGDFKPIEGLADELGAAVGASRAVCDAGWQPNDLQVGQTGKVVAPQLYIAAGISGAIQHVAGMKGSKTIVAVNKDGDAPIFQVADYGVVGDLFKVLPELQAAIKAAK